jgi:hypothetical protein
MGTGFWTCSHLIWLQDAPFFTVKLAIKMLPCVIFFRRGVVVGQVVGFEGLGGLDDFPISALEDKLHEAEVRSQRSSQEESLGHEITQAVRTILLQMSRPVHSHRHVCTHPRMRARVRTHARARAAHSTDMLVETFPWIISRN